MAQDLKKMLLAESDAKEVGKACSSCVDDFLDPDKRRPNVVGIGSGVKWSKGEPTGKPAVIVLVSQKLDDAQLDKADMVPKKLGNVQTDVLTVGHPVAGVQTPAISTQTLAQRVRPAKGGYSVGHFKITAGTIGTCVYDILPGGSARKLKHGIGIPGKFYILSNNHVLANSNSARPGDPILQPGPYDGGVDPRDRIARLSRFIPITFEPHVPRRYHRNLVDAAVAEGAFHDLDRSIYWVGHVRGWRPKTKVAVGTLIQKTGRTTNYATGRITAVNATIDVNYGAAGVARFIDQIVTTPISAGGDSGSLVGTLDNVAVGLLFAGSSYATIANQIENVRSSLRVEVAEEIL